MRESFLCLWLAVHPQSQLSLAVGLPVTCLHAMQSIIQQAIWLKAMLLSYQGDLKEGRKNLQRGKPCWCFPQHCSPFGADFLWVLLTALTADIAA